MVTIRCRDRIFTQIEAILFDKDGTLADSRDFLRNLAVKRARLIDAQIPGVQEPLLMAFGIEGNRLNPAGLTAIGTRYENTIAAAAYVAETGRDWTEAVALVNSVFQDADSYLNRKADHTPPFPGIVDLINRLSATSLSLGVISADSPMHVNDFLQRYDLDSSMAVSLGTMPGEISKPDPAFMLLACEQLGILPNNVLIVGDSQLDMLMGRHAHAAGCIAVSWGWTTISQWGEADVVIDSPEQLEIMP